MITKLLMVSALFITSIFAESLPTTEIMTKDELKEMGLDSLSKDEQKAFENWIGSWTLRVLEQSPSYRRGESLELWIQRWPSYANPKKTTLSKKELEERQLANRRIDKIKKDGLIIELKDGSVWEISPLYTYITRFWSPGQEVEIGQSEDIRFKRTLKNISDDKTVTANMVQPASATGEKKPEDPSQYKGAKLIQSVTEQGVRVSMQDGTFWDIAPVDQYKVRNWKDNDRVRIEPDDNFLYKYRLTNLENGQEALANKK